MLYNPLTLLSDIKKLNSKAIILPKSILSKNIASKLDP